METRIDHIADGIYRIATMTPPYGITFNQFLIDDERPALIHTGNYEHYENVRKAVAESAAPGKGSLYETQMAPAVIENLLRDRPAGWFRDYDEALVRSFADAVSK